MRLRQLIVGGDQEDGDIGERPSVWNSAAAVTPASSVMDAINNISLGSIFEGIRLRSGNNTLLDWDELNLWNGTLGADWDLTDFMEGNFSGVQRGDGSGASQRVALKTAVVACAYALVMAVSLFGNLLVVYVVIRHRRLRSVTYTFLVNVALSDLLMTCLNIPFSVSRVLLDHWPFGELLCSLVPFVQVMSVYVSSLTMAAIAVDRYRVILTPLKRRLRPPHGLIIMLFLWILASLAALPYALYSEVVPIFTYRPLRRCQARFPTPALEFRRYLTIITFITQYVIPLVISGLAYGAIVRRLWLRSFVGAVTDAQRVRQDRAKRKTIQMLLVVISLFALCWLPLNVYHLVSDVGASVSASRHNSTAFLVCHWLAMSSVCYNPFVYCWLNANFRDAVKTCGRLCLRSVSSARGIKEQPSLVLASQNGAQTVTAAAHLLLHHQAEDSASFSTTTTTRRGRDSSIRSVQQQLLAMNQLPEQLKKKPQLPPSNEEETCLV